MKFKVGDKVKVRKDLRNGYFGIENLEDYQNDKIFTIKSGREYKFYGYLYELLEDKIYYDFKEDMLIPVEDGLQERINKAIEYIEKEWYSKCTININDVVSFGDWHLDLLKILRGE